jgi:hypothetical protein
LELKLKLSFSEPFILPVVAVGNCFCSTPECRQRIGYSS